MSISLHLLASNDDDASLRPVDMEELEAALTSSLGRLQAVCDARGRGDRHLEVAACNLAWRVARLILAADLGGVRLPRGYAARTRSSEPYLVKYLRSASEDNSMDAEPGFVLTRKDSIVARMEPGARKLTFAQVLEFQRDLEEGLIDEIAVFIENCNAREEEAAACLNKLLATPKPTDAPKRLAELSRRKKAEPTDGAEALPMTG